AVVEDLAAPGRVEADEQLDEGRLARARGADEREGLAAFGREGDLRERRRRGRLVREADALEGERPKLAQGQRVRRFRLDRNREHLLEHLERRLGLAVGVDHRAELLERAEDEERIDEEREEL